MAVTEEGGGLSPKPRSANARFWGYPVNFTLPGLRFHTLQTHERPSLALLKRSSWVCRRGCLTTGRNSKVLEPPELEGVSQRG